MSESVMFAIVEEFSRKVSFIAALGGGFEAPSSITISVITSDTSSPSLSSVMSLTSLLHISLGKYLPATVI